ncbi:uncharacterized protein LOC113563481 [Ooceraea biroi]|uniref:uncharacterized protein LOC113563481 n=1 Tax=Ooceraea biroi TaxID=2015173 RepID=UPI000F08062F|nr:uncharacterized protein LOC113563481 [Ooceraea biroi]
MSPSQPASSSTVPSGLSGHVDASRAATSLSPDSPLSAHLRASPPRQHPPPRHPTREAGDAQVRSTTDSPAHRTQVLSEPTFNKCRPRPAAQSASTAPFASGRREPQSADFALKSPATNNRPRGCRTMHPPACPGTPRTRRDSGSGHVDPDHGDASPLRRHELPPDLQHSEGGEPAASPRTIATRPPPPTPNWGCPRGPEGLRRDPQRVTALRQALEEKILSPAGAVKVGLEDQARHYSTSMAGSSRPLAPSSSFSSAFFFPMERVTRRGFGSSSRGGAALPCPHQQASAPAPRPPTGPPVWEPERRPFAGEERPPSAAPLPGPPSPTPFAPHFSLPWRAEHRPRYPACGPPSCRDPCTEGTSGQRRIRAPDDPPRHTCSTGLGGPRDWGTSLARAPSPAP